MPCEAEAMTVTGLALVVRGIVAGVCFSAEADIRDGDPGCRLAAKYSQLKPCKVILLTGNIRRL